VDIKINSNKNAQITIQTFFFILMGICFVWILIFGYKQISNISGQLDDKELDDIKFNLKKALTYCNDPLNKGSSKSFGFKSKEFNGICLIGEKKYDEISGSNYYGTLGIELNKLRNTSDNVYLIKSNYKKNGDSIEIINNEYQIIDSIYVDYGYLDSSFCSMEKFEILC